MQYDSMIKQKQTVEPQAKKEVQKVVSSKVVKRKKTATKQLSEAIFSERTSDVADYILTDVLVPAIKDIISNCVTDTINMMLFGSTRRSENLSGSRNSYDYGSYYRKRNDSRDIREERRSRTRNRYNYDEIIVESRKEAEDVLYELRGLIRRYGEATVLDLYTIVGMVGNYTDEDYGWKDLDDARTVRVRDGFLLDLPRAVPLN